MSGWQIVIGIVLLMHGAGHVLGVNAVFFGESDTWNSRSWLVNRLVGDTIATWIGVVLWLAATAGFLFAGMAVFELAIGQDAWRPLAVASAILSTITLALYWHGLPTLFPNKLGALAVNFIILIGVIFYDWPSDETISQLAPLALL